MTGLYDSHLHRDRAVAWPINEKAYVSRLRTGSPYDLVPDRDPASRSVLDAVSRGLPAPE